MSKIQFGAVYDSLAMENLIGPVEFAEMAETWGYDCFWVPEILTLPLMDPLVLLGAVAQRTRRIGLGTSVLVLPTRSPFHLAKAALSVDVLSNGRLILGVGIGGLLPKDFEVEGVDIGQRGRISNERLDILRRLLSETNVSYQGRYHQFKDVTVGPRSVQKPHIPVWVGATWNDGIADRALRRTARYGDGFLSSRTPVADYKQAQDKIKEYANSFGRNPHDIQWASLMWTCLGDSKDQALKMYAAEQERRFGFSWDVQPQDRHVLGTPGDCIETIQQYIELGITHIVFYPICSPDQTLQQCEVLAKEVIPHFRDGGK